MASLQVHSGIVFVKPHEASAIDYNYGLNAKGTLDPSHVAPLAQCTYMLNGYMYIYESYYVAARVVTPIYQMLSL